jgi:ABC-type transporter Mla subunit MlaD
VPRVPISTLLGDLRRVAEQVTRLLGDLSWLMKELEQGSALPALTAALHDLRRGAEELVRLLGDARRLVDGLEEGNLLERVNTIVEAQDKAEKQPDNEQARMLDELSRLVNELESEVAKRRSV